MKNNLKTKVMLALLAGGMLCANGAFAAEADFEITTNGKTSKTGDKYTSSDTIDYTGKTYGLVKGNVDLTNGTQTTNYDGNIIIFRKGKYGSNVYGAWNNIDSTDVTNNKLIIYGGVFKAISGGTGSGGSVKGNKVIIEGGEITAPAIYGGSGTGASCATENEVTIKGGTFSNSSMQICGASSGGDAKDNIVTIEGGTFVDGFKLYGGKAGTGTSSGNKLNLKTKITGTATEVKYFQIMNFTVTPNYIGGTMLNTEKMYFDSSPSTTNVNVTVATGKYAKGSVITLVNATDATTPMTGNVTQGTIPTGSELNLASYTTENKLTLTFTSDYIAPAKPEEKAVIEGIAASLAFVNQGADMVAGSGIDGLYVADSENPTIAAFSGNKTRYNTGSHVDIHGWNALAGVALNNKKSFSHGVFVEIGNGDIDTYAALNGSGSSDYKGGGYMLRKELGKGWNLDGAVRAGRVETGWSNNDKGGYEAKQTYYGAHVTFNKMLKEYGEQKLNGYLRYTFTHLGSDSVNLDGRTMALTA